MPHERLSLARFGTLTSVRPDGRPHAVPIVFAMVAGRLVTAVDQKPKTTRQLVRLDNLRSNPAVSVLVQHVSEDWADLWWVRADGRAEVVDEPDPAWLDALVEKYPQYRDQPPFGPWIVISIDHISEWAHS